MEKMGFISSNNLLKTFTGDRGEGDIRRKSVFLYSIRKRNQGCLESNRIVRGKKQLLRWERPPY